MLKYRLSIARMMRSVCLQAKLEAVVDGANGEVETLQDAVRQVELAVGEDV